MRRAAVPVLLALSLTACGRVGPPVAPEVRLPRAVTDFRSVVRDLAVELSWTNPTQRADNSPLRDLILARVFRRESPPGGALKPALLSRGRIAGYEEVATIPLIGPPGGPATPPGGPETVIEGHRVTLRDRQHLVHGHRYSYVVVVVDGQGRVSPPSERRTVVFIAAPEPPAHLMAEPLERTVRLRWEPPGRLADGSAVTGEILYEVLRARAPGGSLTVVTPTPIGRTEFVDRGLENDRAYEYAVRAVRRLEGTTASGRPSERVAATPVDMTPPSPPGSLVAAVTGQSVRLSWTASPDADVAAYVVYRSGAGGAATRLGAVGAPATGFVDRAVPPGTWRYTVTAVDGGSRANESRPSNEASVSVP